MKLIVGLGNPDKKYENTRHNLGFMAIDYYVSKHNIDEKKEKFHSIYQTFKIDNETVILLKPLTYMNLSGTALKEIVDFYKIDFKDILVIYDDKDIPFASIRIRQKGNPGSHNGIKNITTMLGSNDFARVRIGIGQNTTNMVDFVLSKFNKEEISTLNKTFEKTNDVIDLFVSNKLEHAMNTYNIKNLNEKNS